MPSATRPSTTGPSATRPSATGPSATEPSATGPRATGSPAAGPSGTGLDAADVLAAATAGGGRPRGRAATRLVTGVLAPVATLVVAVAGLRTQVPGGLPAVVTLAFVLSLAWAVAAAVCTRRQSAGQAAPWPPAGGALAGAIALTAARLASQPPAGAHQLARAVATVAGPLVIAALLPLAPGA